MSESPEFDVTEREIRHLRLGLLLGVIAGFGISYLLYAGGSCG